MKETAAIFEGPATSCVHAALKTDIDVVADCISWVDGGNEGSTNEFLKPLGRHYLLSKVLSKRSPIHDVLLSPSIDPLFDILFYTHTSPGASK